MKTRGRGRGPIIAVCIGGGAAVLIAIVIALLTSAPTPKRRVMPDHPLEATFEPFTQSDVRTLPDGRGYVDAQLVLTAAEGTDRATVEALAAQVGAQVVGCLELSGDYQLKLSGDSGVEALEAAAAALSKSPHVRRAGLHRVYEFSTEGVSDDATDWSPDSLRRQRADYENRRDPWAARDAADPAEDPVIPGYPTGNDWWTQAVYLPQAWKAAEHNALAEVRVGIIDGMFDAGHADLPFVRTYLNPLILNDPHGTHVAGIIAANAMNGLDIRGASPNAALYGFAMSVRPLDNQKSYSSDFMLKYAVAAMLGEGVKLFNFSMANESPTTSAYYDAEVRGLDASGSTALGELAERAAGYQDFLERCEALYPDFLIVAAVGNNSGYRWVVNDSGSGYSLEKAGDDASFDETLGVGSSGRYQVLGHIDPASPAAKHILMVGSVDLTINVTGTWTESGLAWSGPQNYMKSVFSDNDAHIYAPGGRLTQVIRQNDEERSETISILSTFPESMGGTGMMEGTSMATPVVTGIAALVWGYRPELTSEQLRFCLTNQAYATNTLLGYTPAELPMVDAVAAMRVADELLGPRTAVTTAPPQKEMALFMGYAYTNPKHSNDPDDYVIDRYVTVTLLDENWVEQSVTTLDGIESFTIAAPPGRYYARIVSGDGTKEYIGEYQLTTDEPTHDAVELRERPYAMFNFGVWQTTKWRHWYENGAGSVAAEISGFGGAIEYEYNGHVTDYDPDDRSLLKAEATGVMSQYGLEVGYTMTYADGSTEYNYYPLGMQMSLDNPGIEPQFFDFDQITPEHLTNVLEISDFAFLVQLDRDQLAALTFTTVGAFNDLTGFGLSDGVMLVQFKPDLSFDTIIFKVWADYDALPYLSASAEYEIGYQFSSQPPSDPIRIDTTNTQSLEGLLEQLFG